MKVAKWGDALAIRLPITVVRELGSRRAIRLTFASPASARSLSRGSQGRPNRRPPPDSKLHRVKADDR